MRREGGLLVADRLPAWAFGRGGTTVGGVFLTRGAARPEVLEHEAVHREQWRRFGLAMIPLYLAAGRDPHGNRFEVQADLVKGGYLAPGATSSSGTAGGTPSRATGRT
ncbi:MAG: Fe-S oxidoreductase [Microbacteriaceae bacterium]|nr:Fe-S oxidoreductase [Microbacteriaceae bacterium]